MVPPGGCGNLGSDGKGRDRHNVGNLWEDRPDGCLGSKGVVSSGGESSGDANQNVDGGGKTIQRSMLQDWLTPTLGLQRTTPGGRVDPIAGTLNRCRTQMVSSRDALDVFRVMRVHRSGILTEVMRSTAAMARWQAECPSQVSCIVLQPSNMLPISKRGLPVLKREARS